MMIELTEGTLMKIFVAGATGAIGRILVPLLLEAGHQVTGTSRGAAGVAGLRALGAAGVRLDMYDRTAVLDAVAAAAPDVIMHQLTALADGDLAANSRIRTEGTRNLVDAARQAGVERIVAQSISWAYQPGSGPAAEGTPLDLAATGPRAGTIAGVRALEDAVAELTHHVILRNGTLYGPGTWYAPGDLMERRLRGGELRATSGVTSFLHVEDAALASVAALGWPNGPVNIVDDEPAPGHDWVPVFAKAVGAPAPEPAGAGSPWERGADGSLARTGRGWQPVHPTWRAGF
jgi:nucleoside-diphosphate-sugar epimerase